MIPVEPQPTVTAAAHQATEERLLALRAEFPILSKATYLVSHSMGAMPRRVFENLSRYASEWNEQGVVAWDAWEPYVLEHGNLIGSLIDAPKDTVIMHQNVSTLVAIALSGLFDPGGRARVITTDLNFPSITYNFLTHQRLGMQVHLIPSPDGMTIPLAAWERAIDDHTLAVIVDHGIFRSGFVQDVRAIAAMAHRRGVHVIVDAYQTTGCVPYSVREWDADIVVGGSHKWLCGGPGAAWMYVRPDLIPRLEPRTTGWFSHANPFAFALTLDYAPNAMRFATGTPGIAGLYAARPGTEMVRDIGIDAIRRKSLRLTQKIIDLADAHGVRVQTPREADRRGGLVVLDFPEAEAVSRQLVEATVLVDYRPRAGIRVSPHFYTTDEEVERIFEAIRVFRTRV